MNPDEARAAGEVAGGIAEHQMNQICEWSEQGVNYAV